ncbi:MAG TPA: HAD family hydrolase [Bauldia sp.]|nr:HAD family hydrolase [Bauldia sp.]
MPPDVDLIVFDCDGVVVDSEILACQALADTLAAYGLPVGVESVFARFLGRSFREVEAYYEGSKGEQLPDSFRENFRSRISEVFRESLKPIAGIRNVLTSLGGPYCLASSSDPGRIKLTLEAVGLTPLFGERVFSANQVARGKPAPDLFLYAAETMGASPSRTLVIEDTVPGVLAGKAAGMKVWGFAGGSHCAGRDVGRKLAAAGADRVFDRMSAFFAG